MNESADNLFTVARLVDHIYRLYRRRYPDRLPELCVVGCCVYALYDCWCHGRYRLGYQSRIWRRGMISILESRLLSSTLIRRIIDRRLPRGWSGLHYARRELAGVSVGIFETSGRRWFHSAVYGDCTYCHPVRFPRRCCLRSYRLFGSSISAQRHRRRIANISTRSPSTRNDKAPTATADLCPTPSALARIHRARRLKCTLLPNSTASRHRHPCLAIREEHQARKTGTRPSRSSPRTQLLERTERNLPNQPNTLTAQRPSTHMRPILKMPTKSVSPNMRSLKCPMSADDGGRRRRRPERPVSRRRTTSSCCNGQAGYTTMSPWRILSYHLSMIPLRSYLSWRYSGCKIMSRPDGHFLSFLQRSSFPESLIVLFEHLFSSFCASPSLLTPLPHLQKGCWTLFPQGHFEQWGLFSLLWR